jgi:hypothetical protein
MRQQLGKRPQLKWKSKIQYVMLTQYISNSTYYTGWFKRLHTWWKLSPYLQNGYHYTDSTYGWFSPPHGELALTHAVLRAHIHLYCFLLGGLCLYCHLVHRGLQKQPQVKKIKWGEDWRLRWQLHGTTTTNPMTRFHTLCMGASESPCITGIFVLNGGEKRDASKRTTNCAHHLYSRTRVICGVSLWTRSCVSNSKMTVITTCRYKTLFYTFLYRKENWDKSAELRFAGTLYWNYIRGCISFPKIKAAT